MTFIRMFVIIMDMKHFMTFSVFIFLPFLNACFKIDNDGVSIHYNITHLSNCGQTDVDDKLRYLKVKLSDCVRECGLGQNCKALNYMRNIQMCDLLSTENSLENATTDDCIYISKKDINVEKTPCGACNDGKECDVKRKTCIHKACPVMNISNGIVFGNMRRVGDKIRFRCSYGYQDVRDDRFAICYDNGEWNATANCTKIECEHPGYLENGQFVLDANTMPLTVATVACNNGYLPSSDNITCDTLGVWQTASCRPISCGMPQTLQDGRIHLNSGTVYTNTATVECSTGYKPSSNMISCTSSGQWESVTCDIISCGVEPSIANGQITADNGNNYQDISTVTCDIGYQSSVATITCLATGVWSTALCQPIRCGSPPNIAYGTIKEVTGVTYMSTARVVCDMYYQPSSENITCKASGSWDTSVCRDCYPHTPKKYAGTKSITEHGNPCVRWDNYNIGSFPYMQDQNFPDGSTSNAENFCRSPDGHPNTWCFINTSNNWENCDVPLCS